MSIMNDFKKFGESIDKINLNDDHNAVVMEKPEFNQAISKAYNIMAENDTLKSMIWNWGYQDAIYSKQISELIPGINKYDTDGLSEQMYYMIIERLPIDISEIKNKKILEVGCGVGGGLNFLSRIFPENQFIGLDLSQSAVDIANSRYAVKNKVEFVYGDAERLPFEDNCFDIIINIESAHNYPYLSRFISEAHRVLKPDGCLSLSDLFMKERIFLMEKIINEAAGLHCEKEIDISEEVKKSIRTRICPNSSIRKKVRSQRGRFSIMSLIEDKYFIVNAYGARFLNKKKSFIDKLGDVFHENRLVTQADSYRYYLFQKNL